MTSEQLMAMSSGVSSTGDVADIEYGGVTDGVAEPEVKGDFWGD